MNPTARYIVEAVYPAAALLLPPAMNTPAAWRMLTAIGLQESRFRHRAQVLGPARGFWQFETAGVTGVLRHEASRDAARDVLTRLCYADTSPQKIHAALEHNDVLAACFARLLLWTDTRPLPTAATEGWAQYLATWRPGKPHPNTWALFFEAAGA